MPSTYTKAKIDELLAALRNTLDGSKAAIKHAAQHAAGGSDPITPASIGALPLIEIGATAAGQDANTYTQPGQYLVSSSMANTPGALNGHLEVIGRGSGSSHILQRFTPSSSASDGRVWQRTRPSVGGAWTDWRFTGPQTAADVGAASLAYSSELGELFSNPFFQKARGGWAGTNYSWGEDSGLSGLLFSGTGNYGEKIACAPGTTVTMHAFVTPHPTEAASPAKLAIQKTIMGSNSFSYDGSFIRETQWISIPAHGASLTATFTVDTDGFRPRIQAGNGRIVHLSIMAGGVAASQFHAPDSFRGTGFPEGVVTAPVGAVYVDTDATSGAVEWTKFAGTGSVGWSVTKGDTGWRNVTNLVPAGILDPDAPGRLLLRRIGQTVHIKADSIKPAADSSNRVDLLDGTLPVNFRPSAIHEQGRFTRTNGITTIYNVTVWSSSRFGIVSREALTSTSVDQGWNATDALAGTMSYLTDTAWPATLPGIPA